MIVLPVSDLLIISKQNFMKTFLIAIAFIMATTSGFAQYRNIEMQAAGLTCSMCSNAINKALKTLPFISDIKTDLSKNLFIISIKENTSPDFDAIEQKVSQAGFSVARMTVEANFDDLEIANDTHAKIGGKTLHFLKVKNQQLSGWKTLQLVDKSFLLQKQFSQYAAATKMTCVKTGYAASCCTKTEGMTSGERIYHVTI